MPRIVRTLNDRILLVTSAWDTAPGHQFWAPYHGEEYDVFADESFSNIFELRPGHGYLCHALLGIPRSQLDRVRSGLKPIFASYSDEVKKTLVASPTEFHFEDFRYIPPTLREDFEGKIAGLLRDSGAVLAAFYTDKLGLIMKEVRESYTDGPTIPADRDDLIREATDYLLTELNGARSAELIAKLLSLPVAALCRFFIGGMSPFRLHFDPRESREDRNVAAAVARFVKEILARGAPEEAALFRGMDSSLSSEQEPLLQVADILVGEVRQLFKQNPALITENSSDVLITPTSEEPLRQYEQVCGKYFKVGILSGIPPAVQVRLLSPADNCYFPLFANLFAAGILTCVTRHGRNRHIEIFEKKFFDQLD